MNDVRTNVCLKPFNTFGIKVLAKRFLPVSRADQLTAIYRQGLMKDPLLVLSEGSNILFTSDVEALVLHNELWGINVIEETDDHVLVEVNAGEHWSSFVDYAVSKGLGGIENLTLIPGKVGAAPVQNIGAYGVEVSDVIEQVKAFDMQSGEHLTFRASDCHFSYRNSIFKEQKGRYFITSVIFRLRRNPELTLSYGPLRDWASGRSNVTLREVSNAVASIRRSKLPDPALLPNAGSFFKNPVVDNDKAQMLKQQFPTIPVYPVNAGQSKLAAGWLIEQSGWKGKRLGHVGVHEKQALVLVNYGEATGEEVLKLAQAIIDDVRRQFGVKLFPEVNIY